MCVYFCRTWGEKSKMSLTNSLTLRSLTHSNLESEKSNIYTENVYIYTPTWIC